MMTIDQWSFPTQQQAHSTPLQGTNMWYLKYISWQKMYSASHKKGKSSFKLIKTYKKAYILYHAIVFHVLLYDGLVFSYS